MNHDYQADPIVRLDNVLMNEMRSDQLQELISFARRLNRPVIATNMHGGNAITPARHTEHAVEGFANLPSGVKGDLESGATTLFFLHFFAAPLINERDGMGMSNAAYTTDGAMLVLDWRYLLDHEDFHVSLTDWMREYDRLISQTRYARESAQALSHLFRVGAFVNTVDDDYIHSTELGTLRVERTDDGETCVPFGAIVCENAAFIPRDLPHSSTSTPLLRHLLSLIEPEGALDPAELEERQREWEERRQERQRELIDTSVNDLKEWLTNLGSSAVRNAQVQVQRTLGVMRSTQAELAELSKRLSHQMATCEALKRTGRKVNPNEIENLRKMLHKGIITGLSTFTDGDRPSIRFSTRTLLVMDERSGAYHLLGKLTITINMSTGSINIRNQTHQIDAFSSGMHTPHTWNTGEPCLGNFSDTVAGFLATGDWYSAIELSIAFAESANTDDSAGKYVHLWPYVADPTMYDYPPYDGPAPTPYDPNEEEYDDPDSEEEEEPYWADEARLGRDGEEEPEV